MSRELSDFERSKMIKYLSEEVEAYNVDNNFGSLPTPILESIYDYFIATDVNNKK
ncbi:hypothetical protein [Clostridium cylindrosporum]|uniref:Uncharacterized protein n=1 Tax=Clostridium cylindrosporum DSM 605 TaxID=1121307 RepID=A0A0J8DE07_CLOCY|nr:hypothetical protein [Clostridium cylindrosporum]KMT22459.1 hypothetical protein CLCY_10c00040 [Clostridium cylindrosporum DSM 605]